MTPDRSSTAHSTSARVPRFAFAAVYAFDSRFAGRRHAMIRMLRANIGARRARERRRRQS